MPDFIVMQRHGSIVEIALNRPQAYNAFDLPILEELAKTLTSVASDPGVRGVVLAGRGKAFCAGGDLKFAGDYPGGAGAAFHAMAGQFHLAVLEIRRMPKPVIAAIQGVAAGGGFSLALACDFRVLETSARMIQAYTSAGLCPDGGSTFSLPRLVGLARALEIIAFDQPITAEKALEWGLATRVVAEGRALDEALSLARQLDRRSMHAYGWSKRLMTDSFDVSLESQMEGERRGLERCGEHPDGREGIAAFIEKRPPEFSPRAGALRD
jgi:2-(1,2-epoxy-1,2-dihydrophenyl)acetyl-CoA isomerase